MKKRGMACLLLAALLLCALWQGQQLAFQRRVAEKVLRLHVLAHSDSPLEQQRKLQVKDAVCAAARQLLEGARDRQQAQQLLQAALPKLQQLACRTLRQQGCLHPVQLRLEYTDFPDKEYDGFFLPAGEYLALRVLIGEARGENWWCVLFPSLCSVGREQLQQQALQAGFTRGELYLLTEGEQGVLLRFRFFRWLKTLAR